MKPTPEQIAFDAMLDVVNEWHRQVGLTDVMKTKLTTMRADVVAAGVFQKHLTAYAGKCVAEAVAEKDKEIERLSAAPDPTKDIELVERVARWLAEFTEGIESYYGIYPDEEASVESCKEWAKELLKCIEGKE
jgi:hypothetical protein